MQVRNVPSSKTDGESTFTTANFSLLSSADGEHLLIENRQPYNWYGTPHLARYFVVLRGNLLKNKTLFPCSYDRDRDWPYGGIVIYKVDNNVDGQKTRGYPGHPNWPKDHYQVAILQADGNYDIEKGVSPGDEGDFWIKGKVLSPGGSWPNTDGYANGQRRNTGITITINTDSRYVMLFQVTGMS
jgi:hypothetical protein